MIPCSSSDTRIHSFNANFGACKLISLKISQKRIIPFSHREGFFLKTSFLFLWWLLLIFLTLAVSTVFLFTCVFNESVYDTLVPWKKKNYERPLLSFCLVWFVVNVLVFVCNGLKQSLILQAKPNRFLQISFFHKNFIYVYFKKASCAYVERLGYEFAAMFVIFVCISYFAS